MTAAHRVHFQLEQEIYERARLAAALDRRSLANWLALLVERALDEPQHAKESAS